MILNEPLIRKVVEYIEQNPKEWDQGSWGVTRWDSKAMRTDEFGEIIEAATWQACGTSACFAGTTLLLTEAPITGDCISDSARTLLGLTEHQARSIFHWFGDAFYDEPEDKVTALKRQITQVTGLTFDDFE